MFLANINKWNDYIYTTVQKFGISKIFKVF